MECWLIVGLGNPEGKYFNTWHNLGFLAAESSAVQNNTGFKKKGNTLICDTKIGGRKVFVLKPLTYMNLSGQAVLATARKYKIAPEKIIVFCDDVYIDIGNIRVATGGGAGGHNGLRSINELLKSTDYIKIRIGARPTDGIKGNTADYVLSKIPDADRDKRDKIVLSIEDAVKAAMEIISGGNMNLIKGQYNKKNTGEM
jgi:PTH1 family peptidyl-tRNA hydrolase